MGWASSAPAAMSTLVTLWSGWPALSGTPVYDGPEVNGASSPTALTVGYTDEMTPNAVEATEDLDSLATAPSRETYTIQCAAWVLNGAGNVATAREAAFALLSAAGAALAADSRLGGAVMMARVGSWTLQQSQTERGAAVQLIFGVSVDAYSGR